MHQTVFVVTKHVSETPSSQDCNTYFLISAIDVQATDISQSAFSKEVAKFYLNARLYFMANKAASETPPSQARSEDLLSNFSNQFTRLSIYL